MQIVYKWLFTTLWVVFLLYWQIAALGTKSNERVESIQSRIVRTAVFLLVVILTMSNWLPIPALYRFYLPKAYWTTWFWTGAAVNALGLGFSVWARMYLGSNWSRSVTIKQDHELITSGPYSLARHPIYTGLLTGFLGVAIALAQLRGLVAFALVFIALALKLRLEEQWMRLQFGAAYEQYARRVPALVPLPSKKS
ncbi:MAG TPA: isoprenylcysteine carboxylmethyltransferase family protein [Terracidiphilus sp.]|jgi:protein-S-isoprenylcysteine O-methyltransferase Ste14